MIKKSVTLAGAAFFAVPAAAILAAGPAMAASGSDVLVSNTETVQAYLNASGKVDVARVYEQVAMEGKGTVDLANPVETRGLRNLDSFGGFDVKGGQMVGQYTVDGELRLRSVSDYTKRLPLEVDVKYFLDGKQVQPGDVVGKAGDLKVQYTVRNVTGKPQEVSFNDGTGKTATATEDVVIPMIGSLTTVLPSTFTDVRSNEANIAGDGRGGTKMSFTMTLFGPIGKPEATFGYEARIADGVIPKASISALPVSPLDSPSFKGGAESYKGGAQTGATLTAGATEIDSNLLKLRDGAGDLLAGLIKLRDGANQLHDGLAGQAAPGAAKLAAGAGDLKNGTGQLKDGAAKAKGGSSQVSDGASQVADGSAALADGLALIQSGVEQLPANPDVADGVAQLKAALKAVQSGIGSPKATNTILWGINQMQDGVDQLSAGLDHPAGALGATDPGGVKQVLEQLMDKLDKNSASEPGAKQALTSILAGLDNASPTNPGAKQGLMNLQFVLGCPNNTAGLTSTGAVDIAHFVSDPTDVCTKIAPSFFSVPGVPDAKASEAVTTKITLAKVVAGLGSRSTPGTTALYGLDQILANIGSRDVPGQTALYALDQLVAGVGDKDTEKTLLYGLDQIRGGLTKVQLGVSNPACDLKDPTKKSNPCGIHQVQGLVSAGIDQLVAGIAASVSDVLGQASAGADQLAGGSSQLADGAKQLDSGLGDLSTGAGKLDAGAGQLKDGANQLSSGLGDAASGSTQLADGLDQAASGAPKIKDGAQQLSDQGTKKLIEAGKSTAADYGQKYALIEAGAQRAKAEGMAYGAPAGAAGQTAYSFELAAADGEGGRNLGRGLGAAVVFALAAGAAMLRRRVV
ncbi:hypothetical protein GCM10027517_27060 [Phycicoccus ginsengisoli]